MLSVWSRLSQPGHDLFAFAQLETKTGKAAAAALSASDALEPADLKVALKREREEHQHLLAESYAAVMDLTKQVACSANVERSGSQTGIFDGINIQMSVRHLLMFIRHLSCRLVRGTGAERSWSCWRDWVRKELSGSRDWERPHHNRAW